ncbi:MAG: hypothetical protein KIT09_08950 [Bryobacteraceae bacterium]|nr:hypothetical protein [Bryobacteraceae bacterium]
MAERRTLDPDEGALSSIRPRIPEPMVFDLVRPLGAERGELEVNSLFRFTPAETPRRLLWAPEIEYTFLDGYGIEFELPLENAGIDAWKAAIQGTLPGPWGDRFIQGWQVLGETGHEGNHSLIDVLYLAGARWSRSWSVFSMTGFRREREHASATVFLGNYSLFFHPRDAVTYGLESNFKGRGASHRGLLLMPQAHIRKRWLNLQAGAGWRWHAGTSGLQIGWRLTREF